MTDIVTISPGHDNESIESSRTFQYSGHTQGWVVPDTMELLTDINTSLAAGPLNQFDESSSSSSLTVTIDTGEAIVGGAALVRDVTTDVTLASNTVDQIVYVGWAHNATDTARIGLSGDFNVDDPRIPLYTYDTDGSGVIATITDRTLGETVTVQDLNIEGGNLYLNEGEAKGFVIERRTDRPSSAEVGRLIYRTDKD